MNEQIVSLLHSQKAKEQAQQAATEREKKVQSVLKAKGKCCMGFEVSE